MCIKKLLSFLLAFPFYLVGEIITLNTSQTLSNYICKYDTVKGIVECNPRTSVFGKHVFTGVYQECENRVRNRNTLIGSYVYVIYDKQGRPRRGICHVYTRK